MALTKERRRAMPDTHTTAGKVINHFSFCRWRYNTAIKLNGQGEVEGTVRFRETEIDTGSDNMRVATIEAHTCKVADISSNRFTETVGAWRDESIAYGLVSAKGTGTGHDDIATGVYQHHWRSLATVASSTTRG